jgi:hypothetical protein
MGMRKDLPEGYISPEEMSKQLRINVDILKKEFTDHIDAEIHRFKYQLMCIQTPGYFS